MLSKKGRGQVPQRSVPSAGSPGLAPALPSQPGQPQSSADDKPRLTQLIQELENARGTRVLVYWLPPTARVSEAAVVPIYDQLSQIGKQHALDLLLFTLGGDTEIPWRLVTLIREFCEHFAVLIPYKAYSAGTLLAMGADEIVMTPLGVLGPIDPSRTHPLLPRREGATEAEPISVQDMRHAMRFISETAKPSTDTPYTPEAMAQIVTALFDKIHPLAIGAIEQSYALAKLIGTRCLSTHMDPKAEKDKITDIVNALCDNYKSHAYQIGRHEAREIGLKVVDAPPTVDSSMMNLLRLYMARSTGIPQKPSPGQTFKLYIAWLDSSVLHLRCEADAQVDQGKALKMLSDNWVPY